MSTDDHVDAQYLFPNVFLYQPGFHNAVREARAEWETEQSNSEWFHTWLEAETGLTDATWDRWVWPEMGDDQPLITHVMRTTHAV